MDGSVLGLNTQYATLRGLVVLLLPSSCCVLVSGEGCDVGFIHHQLWSLPSFLRHTGCLVAFRVLRILSRECCSRQLELRCQARVCIIGQNGIVTPCAWSAVCRSCTHTCEEVESQCQGLPNCSTHRTKSGGSGVDLSESIVGQGLPPSLPRSSQFYINLFCFYIFENWKISP